MDEPEFGKRPITVAEVAKIYGKDPAYQCLWRMVFIAIKPNL